MSETGEAGRGGLVVWLNGAFGAGKSAVAVELVHLLPGATLYDPEEIGFMLRRMLPVPKSGFGFQDLPPWRTLVAHTAIALLRHLRAPLVAPMTLLRHDYAHEIFGQLAAQGVTVHHVLLHTSEQELRRRIDLPQPVLGDEAVQRRTRDWRLRHLPAYADALTWLTAEAAVIDTTSLPPDQIALRILDQLAAANPQCRPVRR